VHYPQISKIVKQTCDELGIEYQAAPTFWRALVSHFSYLKQLGRA
jgi:linoleoyl-CoA desaturase